jgi:hypothetical protein
MRLKLTGAILIGALIGAPGVFAESGPGLEWTPPTAWKAEGSRPMRLNTYAVGEEAECGVYYFGPGQGGSVQANLDRWVGQFQEPPQPPKIQHLTIHGLKVTTVDMSGSYSGMGGPMASSGPRKPGFRLLGAIAEGPEGSVFFKFTGPAKIVTSQAGAFDKMVQSLQGRGK